MCGFRETSQPLAGTFALAMLACLAGCSSGGEGARRAEDPVFALLEESHDLRSAGNFEAAEARLEEALALVEAGSDAEAAIRDELRYSLPMARAR